MGRKKKSEPKLKQVKKEVELKPVKKENEEVELKPVKKEDAWEEDLNIIKNYVDAIEGECSTSYNKIEKEILKEKLEFMKRNHQNYMLNNYEMGQWNQKKFKRELYSKRYRQMELGNKVEIRHTHNGPINSLAIESIENK